MTFAAVMMLLVASVSAQTVLLYGMSENLQVRMMSCDDSERGL